MTRTKTSPGNSAQGRVHPSMRISILLALAMLAVLFMMGSQDGSQVNQISSTPGLTQTVTPAASALPEAAVEKNAEFTNGLIFGAILLLLIIIIGTLAVIRHKK